MRVLIIGAGSIGERHARCFLATGRAEVGICEPNVALLEAVRTRYAIDLAFPDLGQALQGGDSRWDAAVIATPAQMHVPMARRLIEAGIHTLVEKPLSVSLEGVDELIALAGSTPLVTAVAYIHRSNPVLENMHAALQAGRFGKPIQLVVNTGQHFPTYRPAYRSTYYVSHRSGGGAIQDALTHVLNAAEWLVGPINSVVADAAHQILEGVSVEDTAHVLARHGSLLASYSLNQYQAPNEVTLTVVCERGTARMEFHNGRWLSMTEPGAAWQEEFRFQGERDDTFIRQANIFMDCIEGQRHPPCSLEEGLQTLRVNLAVLASVENGRWMPT